MEQQVIDSICAGDWNNLAHLLDGDGGTGDDGNLSAAALTNSNYKLLWQSNSSGWTAMHYAATTLVPMEWWDYLLTRATTAAAAPTSVDDKDDDNNFGTNLFFTRRNSLGQSVLDVFFRTFANPFPWQGSNVQIRATLLLHAIQKVCQGDNNNQQQALSDRIRQCTYERERRRKRLQHEATMIHSELGRFMQQLQQHQHQEGGTSALNQGNGNTTNTAAADSSSAAAVERCVEFWMYLQVLFEAATSTCTTKSRNGPHQQPLNSSSCTTMIGFLAQAGSCPEPIARLALCLYPEQASLPCGQMIHSPPPLWDDDNSNNNPNDSENETCSFLPLHLWAACPNYSCCVPSQPTTAEPAPAQGPTATTSSSSSSSSTASTSMLLPLLQAYPTAVTTRHSVTGRFPLQMALAAGKSWWTCQALFEAHPAVLQRADPVTGLPAVTLPTFSCCWNHTISDEDALKYKDDSHGKTTSTTSTRNSQHNDDTTKAHRPPPAAAAAAAATVLVVEYLARQRIAGDKGLVSRWNWIPENRQQEARTQAANEWDCQVLGTMFEILRACPEQIIVTNNY